MGTSTGGHIPVVVAGGIYTHEDVMHQIGLGADGVQVATRFVTQRNATRRRSTSRRTFPLVRQTS